MDSTKRTFAKACTWQVCGLSVMSTLNYIVLGSVIDSIGLASVATLTGFICYFLHEKVWTRISWGQRRLTVQD